MVKLNVKNHEILLDDEDLNRIDFRDLTVWQHPQRKNPNVLFKSTKRSVAKFLVDTDNKIIYADGNCLNLQKINIIVNTLERKRAYRKKYEADNKQRLAELNREWRKNNPEKVKATLKRFKENNDRSVYDKRYRAKPVVRSRYNEYYKGKRVTIEYRWSKCRLMASKKNSHFDITLEQYKKIISQNCYYCGASLEISSGYSLDRIDNDKGYCLDNVLPCCTHCNRLRLDLMTVDETKKVIDYLKEIRNNDNVWENIRIRKSKNLLKTKE